MDDSPRRTISRELSLGCALALAFLLSSASGARPAPMAPGAIAAASRPDLAGLQKAFRKAGTVDQRIDLLKRMAATSNATPDEIARALSRGLGDDSFLVQARAAALLGKLNASDEALSALLKAGKAFKKDYAAAVTMEPMDVPKVGDKDGLEKLDKMQKQLDRQAAHLKGIVKYQKELVAALLRRKDERCIDVLGQILQAAPSEPQAKDIAEGLFQFGTAPAIKAVIDVVPLFDDLFKERAKERKKLSRERPVRAPKYWKGTKESWAKREAGRINGTLHRFDERTREVEGRLDEFGDMVRALVETTNLAPAPSVMTSKAWAKWWRSERGKLPATLTSSDD